MRATLGAAFAALACCAAAPMIAAAAAGVSLGTFGGAATALVGVSALILLWRRRAVHRRTTRKART